MLTNTGSVHFIETDTVKQSQFSYLRTSKDVLEFYSPKLF